MFESGQNEWKEKNVEESEERKDRPDEIRVGEVEETV